MRALLSVSDKEGIVEFAKGLEELGWQILSTGGTYKLLKAEGVKATEVSEFTGSPEMFEGRVKTLHPKIHGGILHKRDDATHVAQAKEYGIEGIDLVCVNLYPFKETTIRTDDFAEIIENIDIGGPSMLRSAAKNWQDVTVVCNPDNYPSIIEEIRHSGNTTPQTRLRLSAEAYTHTAEYDMKIAAYMRSQAGLSEKLFLTYDLVQPLRYGENPHQSAKFYRRSAPVPYSTAFARQLNGKELSYNNIQDANAALGIVREFREPFCVGVKHLTPCGAAIGNSAAECWQKTLEADPVSIYGGIVATNCEIDAQTATMMKDIFLEIIIAPHFSPEALRILCTKKNLRLLEVDMTPTDDTEQNIVSVTGGLLVQDADNKTVEVVADMCVTDTKPSADELRDLNFGLKIVKHIKSNAICVVRDGATLGIGAGQTNRIGSAEIALRQAHSKGATQNLVLASDAFFPFDDCVELASKMGVTAIVQPGGSIHDDDSVRKANEKGISMMMTGTRHFKH